MSKPINRIAGACLQSKQMAFWRRHRKQFFYVVIIILIQLTLLAFLYQDAKAQCSLFCNAVTNVALDVSCETEIWYDMILEDPYNPLVCAPNSPPSFEVIVMNQAGTVLNTSPHVTASNIGQSLMVKVRHLPTMNSCWGRINIQDNLAPLIICPPDTAIACSQSPDTTLTGRAIANDCSWFQINYEDQVQNFPCQPSLQNIIRTWRATDNSGHQSHCIQNIFVKRPELDAVSFPPNHDGIQSPAISCDSFAANPPLVEPDVTGYPTIAGQPFSNGGSCTLGYAYEDRQVPLCQGSFKVLRKWTIVNWCTSTLKEHYQIIKIEDDKAPMFTLPDTLRVSTNSGNGCSADVSFPPVSISDNCSSHYQVSIFSNYGSLFQNGGTIAGFPPGNHLVFYTVADDCGNSRRDSLVVQVFDGIAPVAICRTSTQVGLGSDGTALVNAHLFDEGSYDNCCLASFAIKPLHAANQSFAPQILLDCSQLDTITHYTVKVEDCAGNQNFCTVQVNLKESVVPVITCPQNQTLTCFEDANDLLLTGMAQSTDNCGIDTTWFEDDDRTDLCQTGTIYRTWYTADHAGNQSSCLQQIELRISGGITVQFPGNLEFFGCISSRDSLHPDSIQSRPFIQGQTCGQVGKNYFDEVYHTQSGACYTIRRTWKVIDWCVYDTSQGDDGWYEQVQTIHVFDTLAPTIQCPPSLTIHLDGQSCTDTIRIPRPVATSNCNQQINFSISGDLGVNWTVPDVAPGDYRIRFFASDNCGNQTSCSTILKVRDSKPPVAQCKTSVVVDLPATRSLAIPATDFNSQSLDNCSIKQDLTFRIERSSQFSGIAAQDRFVLVDCDDLQQQTLVHLWVGDKAGNWSACQSTLLVQDNFSHCPNSTNKYIISGKIESTMGVPAENAEVLLYENGLIQQYAIVNQVGEFRFQPFTQGAALELIPYNNKDYLQGITTMDLVLLLRHYLGYQPFHIPELLLAGDIDNNQVIDSMDVVYLRKCLLRTMDSFPDNTSWRFIPADYTFQHSNPLMDSVPEKVVLQRLTADTQLDFTAIKIGDLDESISNHAKGNVAIREGLQFNITEPYKERKEISAVFEEDIWGFQLILPTGNYGTPEIHSSILHPDFFHWKYAGNQLVLQYAAPYPIAVKRGTVLFEINGAFHLDLSGKMEAKQVCLGKEEPELAEGTIKIGKSPLPLKNIPVAYPNPSTGCFYLSGIEDSRIIKMIHVRDWGGKLIQTRRVQSDIGKPAKIDLTALPAGSYWLDIRFANYNPVKIAVFKW